MITYSASVPAAAGRLRALAYTPGGVPAPCLEHLLAAVDEFAPVDVVVKGFEVLWAFRDDLSSTAREVAADLAYQVMAYSFHGKGERAGAALRHLRADAGEGPTEDLPEAPEAESYGA